MTQADKSKNIFQAAIDAVSNRDEKAAVEAAAKHAAELEGQVADLQLQLSQCKQQLTEAQGKADQLSTDLSKAQADLSKANSDLMAGKINLNTIQNQLTDTTQRYNAANTELQKYISAEQAKQAIEAAVAAEKARIMCEHELKFDETLSHLALKYYGSAYEPYWRVIYEANKDVIGPDPGRVRPGTILKIPVLPEELKQK